MVFAVTEISTIAFGFPGQAFSSGVLCDFQFVSLPGGGLTGTRVAASWIRSDLNLSELQALLYLCLYLWLSVISRMALGATRNRDPNRNHAHRKQFAKHNLSQF